MSNVEEVRQQNKVRQGVAYIVLHPQSKESTPRSTKFPSTQNMSGRDVAGEKDVFRCGKSGTGSGRIMGKAEKDLEKNRRRKRESGDRIRTENFLISRL